jgi:nucleotide-binding universal stress UspA family protein
MPLAPSLVLKFTFEGATSVMIPPKLILAPIDFSDYSRNALQAAAAMASAFGATLLLAYVVPAIPDLPAGVSMLKEGEYDTELLQTASTRLSELASTIAKDNLSVRTEIGTANDVGMELIRIAEREQVDLIVIATHGMTGWRRIAFGSVALKVVEHASCPVLVLRAQEAGHTVEPEAHSASSATA